MAPDRNSVVGSFREGSNPSRSTNSPVAQWYAERAATNREAEGSNPSWGASHGAVTQKKECPFVEREVAGSSPAGAANSSRRVTQWGE